MAEAKTQRTTKAATGADPAPKADTDETGIVREDVTKADVTKAVEHGDQDRVAMASRRADGTPDQTAHFTYQNPEAAREASEWQLTEQAVSNADQVIRVPADAVTDGEGNEGSSAPDPAVARIVQVHEQAAETGRKRLDGEIREHS